MKTLTTTITTVRTNRDNNKQATTTHKQQQ